MVIARIGVEARQPVKQGHVILSVITDVFGDGDCTRLMLMKALDRPKRSLGKTNSPYLRKGKIYQMIFVVVVVAK